MWINDVIVEENVVIVAIFIHIEMKITRNSKNNS